MVHLRSTDSRSAGAALALLAALVLLSASAGAGLLTSDEVWPSFGFRGSEIDYDPDPAAFSLALREAAAHSVTDPLAVSGQYLVEDPLSGSLFLLPDADVAGDLTKIGIAVFGIVPPAEDLSDRELLKDTFRALGSDADGRPVDPLIDNLPMTGSKLSAYRDAGIFIHAAGIDEVTWINGYRDSGALMQLLKVEDAVARGLTLDQVRAIPQPAIPSLVAVALASLASALYRARRGRPMRTRTNAPSVPTATVVRPHVDPA